MDAVTIGVPSMVDRTRSIVLGSQFKGVGNVNLAEFLQNKLGYKVIVDRDVNYLLIHDIYKYDLDPEKNRTILGFYIGTGLGNPIYIHGNIYRGKNGVAGELAHTPLYGLKEMCPCGNEGCVEVVASGKALEKIKNKHFPGTPMGEVFLRHGDTKEIAHFIELLSYPIATEITILDPDYVLFPVVLYPWKDFRKICCWKR